MTLPVTGYLPPRLAELRQEMVDTIKAEYGGDINLNSAESLLGRITDIFCSRTDENAESIGDLSNARNEDEAEGVYLDNMYRLIGFPRLEATQSSVNLILKGNPGTSILPGALVKDVYGREWRTVALSADLNLDPGVAVPARSVEYGPIAAAYDEINVIITPQAGWTSVSNHDAAVPGRLRETDAQYRARKRRFIAIMGSANAAAIRANILAVDPRIVCRVLENDTDIPIVIEGFQIPGHTIMAVVAPLSLVISSVGDRIAVIIWRHAPAGIRSVGDQYRIITDAAGQAKTVRMQLPPDSNYDVSVTPRPYSLQDVTAIEEVVEAYFDGLDIGQQPSTARAACGIVSALPHLSDCVVVFTGADPIPLLSQAKVGAITVNT